MHSRARHGRALWCTANPSDKVGTAVVIPLTTQRPRAGYPLTVHLPAGTGGNPVECWARITQIRTVSATRCQEQAIGRLSEVELTPIKAALIEVLDVGT